MEKIDGHANLLLPFIKWWQFFSKYPHFLFVYFFSWSFPFRNHSNDNCTNYYQDVCSGTRRMKRTRKLSFWYEKSMLLRIDGTSAIWSIMITFVYLSISLNRRWTSKLSNPEISDLARNVWTKIIKIVFLSIYLRWKPLWTKKIRINSMNCSIWLGWALLFGIKSFSLDFFSVIF